MPALHAKEIVDWLDKPNPLARLFGVIALYLFADAALLWTCGVSAVKISTADLGSTVPWGYLVPLLLLVLLLHGPVSAFVQHLFGPVAGTVAGLLSLDVYSEVERRKGRVCGTRLRSWAVRHDNSAALSVYERWCRDRGDWRATQDRAFCLLMSVAVGASTEGSLVRGVGNWLISTEGLPTAAGLCCVLMVLGLAFYFGVVYGCRFRVDPADYGPYLLNSSVPGTEPPEPAPMDAVEAVRRAAELTSPSRS